MSAIPSNGKQLVQWLRRDGWQVVRQRGGHLQMRHPSGAQHTVALGMAGRNITNAVAELRRRGLVGTGSKLARPTATSGEVVTMATIAEHIEATGQPAPPATPATVGISPSLRFRLGVHLGVGGWAVSIDDQTQPPLPGLLPALVGAALTMTEAIMGYPVPAEVKASLVKALKGGQA